MAAKHLSARACACHIPHTLTPCTRPSHLQPSPLTIHVDPSSVKCLAFNCCRKRADSGACLEYLLRSLHAADVTATTSMDEGGATSSVSQLFRGSYAPHGTPFWVLLLPVPAQQRTGKAHPTLIECMQLAGFGPVSRSTTSRHSSLQGALRGSEAGSAASARRYFDVLPPYLVLQFKPTIIGGRAAGCPVSFPTRGLDLSTFLSDVCARHDPRHKASRNVYDLRAVVYFHPHMGDSNSPNTVDLSPSSHQEPGSTRLCNHNASAGGHYTAVVLRGNKWWLCDDATCRRIEQPAIVNVSRDDCIQHVLLYSSRCPNASGRKHPRCCANTLDNTSQERPKCKHTRF